MQRSLVGSEMCIRDRQYGMSLNFGKLGFDFRINRGFGEKEIVYVEKVLGGNKNQIVRTDGLMTMLSAKYRF